MSKQDFHITNEYQCTYRNISNNDDQLVNTISKSLHLQTVYSRGKKLVPSQFLRKSTDQQNLNMIEQKKISPKKYSQSKLQILLQNNSNKFVNAKQLLNKYSQKCSNIKIVDQAANQSNMSQQNKNQNMNSQNQQNYEQLSKKKFRRIDHSIKFNTEPKKIQQNKVSVPFSASPSKRKLVNFQQPKFKDDFSEDDNENYYLPQVEQLSKKMVVSKQRSSSPLKNLRTNSNAIKGQKNENFKISLKVNKRYIHNLEQQSTRREEASSSSFYQNSQRTAIIPQNQIIREQLNQKQNQEKQKQQQPIFSSEEENKVTNDETEFSDDMFKHNIHNISKEDQKTVKMSEIQIQRRDGFIKKIQKNDEKDVKKQKSIISSNNLSLNSTDSQDENTSTKSKICEKNPQLSEDPINQEFLEEFTQVNKLFVQDNLELQVLIDRERVQLFHKKSSSADVMVSINLPEKTESAINRYVSMLRKVKLEAIEKNSNSQINCKKYQTKDYTWSPYDLVILIDDNISVKNMTSIKSSINFIVQQSSQFDRICLIFPNSQEITKSKLVKCDLSNKEYLKDILKYVNPRGDVESIELLDQALEILNKRQEKNFISQIYYFTEGYNIKKSDEMINLLQKKNQFTYFLSTFHLKNNNCDSSIQQISYSQQGDYHFIEDTSNLPLIAAKALGQLKSTVGFKSSAMIMPTLDKKFIEKITTERRYGGSGIWKEDDELEAQSIDLYNLIAGCSKNYSLRYSFPATGYLIGDEWIEKPTFKAACLVFFESQKYQQYIYNEQIKKVTFENGDIYKTEQESLINNPYNPTVLRNSFKYQIIDSFEILIQNLQDKLESEYSLIKFEENLESILQEYFVEISLHFEEFLEDIAQLHQKIQKNGNQSINNNLNNLLNSFLNAHKYQKSQLSKTDISFNTQISEYYMNYAQFYFQRICQNQIV
ncbi:hypothetical protein TTHERM_00151640 (macronuclear) [Tetrahymena thermophila SB210]|uniref:VWFA domain-containing protein n=1 Tax=Tetrahymena thermophila (strain SB210) TaxID=312017 RepID=I7M2W9_TETTS|nr:hypothetical protein TTHERM_00151640 [Tetrahymena thermophila SB210]EAS01451.1 hypothetical protein TTHERM_00151640 [Tetrahymena thermophila SB210]|eukprot:XP_001021697.1 hypothetical protein TTHERM_00151640 [Tetrahymena thermophila SB210]